MAKKIKVCTNCINYSATHYTEENLMEEYCSHLDKVLLNPNTFSCPSFVRKINNSSDTRQAIEDKIEKMEELKMNQPTLAEIKADLDDINLEEAATEQPVVAPTEMDHDVKPQYKTNQIILGKMSDIMPFSWQLQRFIRLYASFSYKFKAPNEFTYKVMNELIKTFENKIKMGQLTRRDYTHTFEQECCRVARVLLENYPSLKAPSDNSTRDPNKIKGITLQMVTEGSGAWDFNYTTRIVK